MKFEKYHGLGNDFIIIDYKEIALGSNIEQLAKDLCNRFTGIGSDGLVIAGSIDNEYNMIFIDPSGYRDKMCGNAIRCLSYYYKRHGYEKNSIDILTDDGLKNINIIKNEEDWFIVEVNMGTFDWTPSNIPAISNLDKIHNVEFILSDGYKIKYSAIKFGPAHVIIFLDELNEKRIYQIVKELNKPTLFPEEACFNFAHVIDKNNISLKTWERGIGITLACGTGSCATAVISLLNNLTSGKVNIHQTLGTLSVELRQGNYFMQGPAEFVYSGEINIKNKLTCTSVK